MSVQQTRTVSAVRAFNRFYTRVAGLLDKHILHSPYALAEARLLYEIWANGPVTSRTLVEALDMDPGQLSRLLSALGRKNLVQSRRDETDGRVFWLTLTEQGDAAANELNTLSEQSVARLVEPLSDEMRTRLANAMTTITSLLSPAGNDAKVIYRPHKLGELGWLIHRQALLYRAEYGWNGEFETLIARIYHEYEEHPDTARKSLWIAELDDAVAGSIYVLPNADDPKIAQLRMLYVEPEARGHQIGRTLVDKVVGFSRDAGYHGVMLWTQDCLTSARRIYQGAGFQLTREDQHHSFGVDLNGQYWALDFDAQ
ncbi:MAG: MarR family transcriptional regulator [Hyphomicrobiaceae bacterium]|nr:MarR family transcriptional regulator [Hyphomicrobiaceae bacterium]MCC0022689.1 MarR family transcriptional regulator [Hyphomicrobiaceae bacterium]